MLTRSQPRPQTAGLDLGLHLKFPSPLLRDIPPRLIVLLACRHLQSPVCKAFRHVKVDTLSQPEALSQISVPGSGPGAKRPLGWGAPDL